MVTLKPGMNTEVVWQNDETSIRIALKTTVYDVEEHKIILAQTVPPIKPNKLGKLCMVNFVAKQRDSNVQFAFQAQVAALLADYKLNASNRVPALVLEMRTKPQVHNTRSSFRIKPLAESGISLLLQGLPVSIIDISVGGAQVNTRGQLSLQAQDIVKATLIIGNEKLTADCLITRAWVDNMNDKIGPQYYATLNFVNPHTRWESLLGGKILKMEREILAKKFC